MDVNESFTLGKNILNTLGTHNLKLIQTKGDEMDKEMVKAMDMIESQLYKGHSQNKLVTATINGKYEIIDISIDVAFSDWMDDQIKTLALITEAVNDAIYMVDLEIETQLSTIEYQYLGDVITKASFPDEQMEYLKNRISNLKK